MRGSETIIVIPASGQDEYGDPLPVGQPRPVEECAVIPRRVNSPERGMVLIAGYEIFAPATEAALAITERDAIEVRGVVHQVDGEPGHYVKNGQSKVVQVFVKRVGT